MSEFIVKLETSGSAKNKNEWVQIRSQDRLVDMEQPVDEATRKMLGSRMKAYFKARLVGKSLIFIGEASWTDWKKQR